MGWHAVRDPRGAPPLPDLRHDGDPMAWLFDGIDDYATIAPDAALALGEGDWTLAGWVRVTSNAGIGLHVLPVVERLRRPSIAATGTSTRRDVANPNKLRFFVRDSQGNVADAMSTGTPGASDRLAASSAAAVRRHDRAIRQRRGRRRRRTPRPSARSISRPDAASRRPLRPGPESLLQRRHGRMGEVGPGTLGRGDRRLGEPAPRRGTSPAGLAWHLPMLDYQERIAGLTVANHGSTLVDHPPEIVQPRGASRGPRPKCSSPRPPPNCSPPEPWQDKPMSS